MRAQRPVYLQGQGNRRRRRGAGRGRMLREGSRMSARRRGGRVAARPSLQRHGVSVVWLYEHDTKTRKSRVGKTLKREDFRGCFRAKVVCGMGAELGYWVREDDVALPIVSLGDRRGRYAPIMRATLVALLPFRHRLGFVTMYPAEAFGNHNRRVSLLLGRIARCSLTSRYGVQSHRYLENQRLVRHPR